MGEFVDSRMESMIPEMKLMLRNKLFTTNEIQIIINKRREFEYKIKKLNKSKKDYIHFIAFETNLYHDIKQRREQSANKKDMEKIDLPVARRIDNLYKKALLAFASDVRMWTSYIKFCTTAGFNDSISKAFYRILQIHMDKPQLWDMAAKWEKEKNNSVENALNYLVRGLGHHPKDELLHTEAFKFTLLQARDKEVPDIMQAEIMYKSALKNVHNAEFIIGLLRIAEQYNFTEPLQKKMVHDLKELFANEEIVWHTIAQKALLNKGTVKVSSSERFASCLMVYREAVEKLKTKKMWCLYIESMLELNQDKVVYLVDERKALEAALEEGHNSGMMCIKHYLHWLQILANQKGSQDKILKLAEAIPSKIKQSIELWESLLRYHIVRNDPQIVRQVFDQAVKALAEESYPIWKLMIMYQLSLPDADVKVRDIFYEALRREPGKVLRLMQPKYLEWLTVTKHITWARNAYTELTKRPPVSLELHQRMAFLESLQIEPNMKHWRMCHENATNYFGKDNKDVWIEFIKFEKYHGEPNLVPVIYDRAKKTLNATLIDMFELDFNQV